MSIGGIYEILNTINRKRYVGSAVNFEERWRIHQHFLFRGKHHSRYLQNAWSKYSPEAFEFRPLLICSPKNNLFYEQRAMDILQPEYNMSPTAHSQLGIKRSPEFIARMSAARMGRKLSPETIAKRSAKLRGRIQPPEERARRSASLMGRVMSKEWRDRLADAKRGKAQSPEHIAKRVERNTGQKRTLKQVERIRAGIREYFRAQATEATTQAVKVEKKK